MGEPSISGDTPGHVGAFWGPWNAERKRKPGYVDSIVSIFFLGDKTVTARVSRGLFPPLGTGMGAGSPQDASASSDPRPERRLLGPDKLEARRQWLTLDRGGQ